MVGATLPQEHDREAWNACAVALLPVPAPTEGGHRGRGSARAAGDHRVLEQGRAALRVVGECGRTWHRRVRPVARDDAGTVASGLKRCPRCRYRHRFPRPFGCRAGPPGDRDRCRRHNAGRLDRPRYRRERHVRRRRRGGPAVAAESFDVVVSRSLLWTLREPRRAFASWWRLLRPGGRVVAIYGLAPPGAPDEGLYTAATRDQLPAMHLEDHDIPVQAAEDAGFRHISTTALHALRGWETSPGSDLPHALTGYRPPPA